MVQDDNTTSSDLRASRSAHRFVKEQEAKRRAAPTSRSPTPGAQSSEVDVESRNNRRSHRDRHSPHRDRDHGRSRRHRSHDRKDDNGNRHRDDRHRRHRSGSHDRDDLDREAKRRAQHGRSRSGSHDRDDLDGEAKRRAQHGRSTSVGATSVGAGTRNSTERRSTRKNREEEDRRSKQRARRPNSTSGTPTPGATAASRGDSVSKGSVSREDARERKLRRAGLGLDGSDREDTGPQKNDNLPAAAPPAAAAAAGGDDDGAVQLQAMLVDDDGENSNLKKDIQAENERMKRELAEQNERMRQQMQEDQERFLEERRQQEQAEAAEKKRKQRRNVCILVIFLLATAIGVGAYFATKEGSSESTSAAVPPATQAPVTQAPATTNAPIPPAPTAAPIAVTAAPTAEEPLHDAPSDMDCVAIANADTVEGQEEDTEKVLGFDTLLEMTLSTSTDPKLFSDDLKEQMQKRIMPKMAGCESAQFADRKNLRNRRRELQANKYVVLNAQIDSTDVLDEACSNSDESNCFKVLAKMNLFLQGEEKKTVLVEKIDKLLKGKENNEDFELARKLGLSNFVTSLTCVGVYPNDPTPAPSQNPTNTPSVPPTNPPTGDQATPRPTPKPTPNPTPAPTPKPTEEECTDRCQGDRACESFDLDRFDVGCGSCNGAKSCLDAEASIGEESCLEGGCEGVSGEIGDRSCHGRKACRDLVNVEIGNDSCRCDGCCACIRDDDFIPSGSCNSIAETRDDVDYKPYDTTERVEFCCLEPGSDGGEGGNAPPAPPEG